MFVKIQKAYRCLFRVVAPKSGPQPGQCVCYLHPQEHCVADYFHCCVVNREGCVAGLVASKVNDDLLCFSNVQSHVIGLTQVHFFFLPPPGTPGCHCFE